MIRGRLAAAEKGLYRVTATTESDRRFADQNARAFELWPRRTPCAAKNESRQRAQDRYREFLDKRDAAFFQDTQFGGLESTGNLPKIRQFSLEALAYYATPGQEGVTWKLAPLADSLSFKQKEQIVLGCYEMLLVLAEAVARPLPDESPTRQAKKALEILDRGLELRREPTRAYYLRRAACLKRANQQSAADRELAAAKRVEPAGAFRSFLERIGEVQQRPVPGSQAGF